MMEELFEAIETDDLFTFSTLIHTNPDLIEGQYPDAPLNRCVTENRYLFVRALLAAGADPNKEWEDSLPLVEAAMHPDTIDALYELLKAPNIDVNAFDADGFSALSIACQKSNVPALDALLSHPHIHVNLKEPNTGKSAIYEAIHDFNVFEIMYNHGANIDVVDNSGARPLDRLFYYYINTEEDKMGAIYILNTIKTQHREYLYFSSTAVCNMLRSEHIEPSVFDEIFTYFDKVDFARPEMSPLTPDGYTPLEVAVSLGLIQQTSTLIEKTQVDVHQLTPFIFNTSKPTSSMYMLSYLLTHHNLDLSRYPALTLALKKNCYDCAYYMLTHNIGLHHNNAATLALYSLFSSNISLVIMGVDKNVFRFQDMLPNSNANAFEEYIRQSEQTINLDFLNKVVHYVCAHQGCFHWRHIPDWLTNTEVYATYQQFNTLRHRSLSAVPDYNSDGVKAFKHYRQHNP